MGCQLSPCVRLWEWAVQHGQVEPFQPIHLPDGLREPARCVYICVRLCACERLCSYSSAAHRHKHARTHAHTRTHTHAHIQIQVTSCCGTRRPTALASRWEPRAALQSLLSGPLTDEACSWRPLLHACVWTTLSRSSPTMGNRCVEGGVGLSVGVGVSVGGSVGGSGGGSVG